MEGAKNHAKDHDSDYDDDAAAGDDDHDVC